MNSLTQSKEWLNLLEHYSKIRPLHMRELFAAESERKQKFTLNAAGLSLDYSKNRITDQTLDLLFQLAQACQLETKINQMFQGEIMNTTEQFPALHIALRKRDNSPIYVNNQDVMPHVRFTLNKMRLFIDDLFQGQYRSASGACITDVVNIGVGGSERGARLAINALKPYKQEQIRTHFLANIDGYELTDTLQTLNPDTTIFFISSKSFSTAETLLNTTSIKNWLGNPHRCKKQLFAITSKKTKAINFGIEENHVFEIWDWVGGRYSLWSAIGLPIAIAIGMENFEEMLEGAFLMDQHFYEAPFHVNIPVILGLLGIWYTNFFQAATHAILPYSHLLQLLPSYISQLDMESNGKNIDMNGNIIEYNTAPIIWGEVGCNGQHSFHQLLFQGNHLTPADFILPFEGHSDYPEHQQFLIANCISQGQALMYGQTKEEVNEELRIQNLSEKEIHRIAPFKVISGNQPSNTISMTRLTPKNLGSLLALYEHKVFVQSVIWRINPFDQFGVELGKKMAKQLLQNDMK